jgi:asparagine synthase (glutamine-hydrolysing)
MCGICGVVNLAGAETRVSRERFVAMRESLAHRGPDDAGLFEGPGVRLGHRRLIVVDPTDAGHQPMATACGRFVLVYNGELYNDRELRGELERAGVAFRTACDTETVLHAVARWGPDAGSRMRGMYALALWDVAERTILLGRDGFGMKPLLWARAGDDLVFASEAHALFEHPGLRPQPDAAVVSSYLSTVRETLGERTMFKGVRTLRPGEWLRFTVGGDAGGPDRTARAFTCDGAPSIAEVVESSVRVHLRSDVPWCSLLSGGLDSTVVAAIASDEIRGAGGGPLRTYVSGCPDAGDGLADDFGFAREAAGSIGTLHREVPVGSGEFASGWSEIVERTGLPLTTPNTVAIWRVARALRSEGHVVTLSGEGADELFGGYEMPLGSMSAHVAECPGDEGDDGAFALRATAWIQPAQKAGFLAPDFWEESERDALLDAEHRDAIADGRRAAMALHPEAREDELRMLAYLDFQRRLNLTGLLQRLDAATMLASVEGRTPFADGAVAAAADRLGMARKFVPGDGGAHRSKIALREAFRGRVPASIADRPKRSFPLPFTAWLGEAGDLVRGSGLVRRVYAPIAIEVALTDPAAWWHVLWPMANLALWDRRWWGS